MMCLTKDCTVAAQSSKHGCVMKARLQMIGEYDEESKTYAIMLLADESEVNFDEFKDGDEVEIRKVPKVGDA